MLYEISLCIRTVNSSSKLSYYERWLINPETHAPYFQPILEKVFKREQGKYPISPTEHDDQWYVLVDSGAKANEPKSFKKGRELIREYLDGGLFNTSPLVIKE